MPATATDRLQGLTTSVAVKPPCRVATTAAITLFGLQTIDGVSLAEGDRVLVKNQADPVANGIYTVAVSDWVRALDFDGSLDAVGGTQLFVDTGTTLGNSYWRVAGSGVKTIGTDAITFEQGLLSNLSAALYEPENVSGEEVITALRSGTLGRGVPDDAFDVLPIKIVGIGPRGLQYSEDAIGCAYRTETSDGQFSTGAVFCAPYGSDTSGDGSLGAPFESVNKAFTATTITNIRLLPAADGGTGFYEPWSLRSDTNPDGCAQLRVLIAHGPITFKKVCNDISVDAIASGTIGMAGHDPMTEGDLVDIDSNAITWTATPSGPLDILLDPGDGREQWAQDLTDCINANTLTLGVNATYLSLEDPEDPESDVIVLINANTPGTGGNAITLSCTSAEGILTASDTTLLGGGDGWTGGTDGVWDFQTTTGFALPRALVSNAIREPNTGQPTPFAYYGNVRRLTFSGQPTAGHLFTITSGYSASPYNGTFTVTFVASGGGTTLSGTANGNVNVNIGATLAETLTNVVNAVNTNALFFGLVADHNGTVVRLSARLNSNATITGSVTGGTMSLGAQTAGKDELATFALTASGNNPFAAFSVGGWAFNETTLVLSAKMAGGLDIQANKSVLELIVGTSTDRCFVFGGRIGLLGNFQFRGTHIFATPDASDPVTFPTRIWATFTNPADRPAGFISPMDSGLFEVGSVQTVVNHRPPPQGAWGYCSTIDTFHITTSTTAPVTQVIRVGSEFAGDPFTFPVIEFPNRNAISPHGTGCITAAFESNFNHSVGPNIVSGTANMNWLVDVRGDESWGLTNQSGFLGVAGATYYLDLCSFAGNADGDAVLTAGDNFTFRLAAFDITGTGTPYIPPPLED